MGLNFGDVVLNKLNLIRVKEKTLSSLYPYQNLLVRFNLLWEMRDPREG
jgi:hypothetical protein